MKSRKVSKIRKRSQSHKKSEKSQCALEVQNRDLRTEPFALFSWAKAPALYVTMSQVGAVEEGHFLDLAFRAHIELRIVKVKVTLR